jgi:hypothetical protein
MPANPQLAPSGGKSSDANTVKPPPPLMKWGQPAMSWESQVEKRPATPGRAAEPVVKPAKKSKPTPFASEHQPISSASGSASAPSPALTVPVTPIRWQRPVASEESEPRAEQATKLTKPTKPVPKLTKPAAPPAAVPVPVALPKPATPPAAVPVPVVRPAIPGGSSSPGRALTYATPRAVPLDRPSHWPPAYDVRPPEPKNGHLGLISFDDDGQPGVITFDDGPDPKSAMMANLKRQVQFVCGKQARDVFVEGQPNGNVMVKVKVANPSNEDRLTRKILTIPEMASPKVRLTMDISP